MTTITPSKDQQARSTNPIMLQRENKYQRELLAQRKRAIGMWQAVAIAMFVIALLLLTTLFSEVACAQTSIITVPTGPGESTVIMCFDTDDGGKVCY